MFTLEARNAELLVITILMEDVLIITLNLYPKVYKLMKIFQSNGDKKVMKPMFCYRDFMKIQFDKIQKKNNLISYFPVRINKILYNLV